MYTEKFNSAMKFVFEEEGGVNTGDPVGGLTNMGVTQKTLDAYRRAYNPNFPGSVLNLTKCQARQLYYDMFWREIRAEEVPQVFSLAMFDYAVNSSPYKAILRLQQVLRIKVDGIIGPKTMAAIYGCDREEMIDRYLAIRFTKWAKDRQFEDCGFGWFCRGVNLARECQKLMWHGNN